MTTRSDAGPPRDPGVYRRTNHFRDALGDGMRFLTEEMVEETIRSGGDEPRSGGPGKVRRKRHYDGVWAVLVISKADPVLITGWTEVGSWVEAMASDRWTQDQLSKMRAFMDEEHKRPVSEQL